MMRSDFSDKKGSKLKLGAKVKKGTQIGTYLQCRDETFLTQCSSQATNGCVCSMPREYAEGGTLFGISGQSSSLKATEIKRFK